MLGFASIAREAGFDVWMTMVTTATVFGMPGQVAFASLWAKPPASRPDARKSNG
jgi:predicted branched-subunit amino acid permease